MSSSFRRLAKDHAALRKALPPNYIFEDAEAGTSLPDDLTQLIICLTGADGTPYAQGLWKLHLRMPIDYPKNPPKATFTTRIFHPNVEEETGAVCLETLKRDWDPKLTLKDILVTISCLLIYPNPDSALNAKAGSLIQEDYDGFSRQAKLMTSIHAPIPRHLKAAVSAAKRRGEDTQITISNKPVDTKISKPEFRGISRTDSSKENNPCEEQISNALSPLEQTVGYLGKRSLLDLQSSENEQAKSIGGSEELKGVQLSPTFMTELQDEPRRKSPKHAHGESADRRDESIPQSMDKIREGGEVNVPVSKQVPIAKVDGVPERSIPRSISSTKSGTLRKQARVGIRRL